MTRPNNDVEASTRAPARLLSELEDDAVEVLYRSTRQDHPGIFNVAGDGVLLLSQAIRICGKVPFPVILPLTSPLAAAFRRLRIADFPADQVLNGFREARAELIE